MEFYYNEEKDCINIDGKDDLVLCKGKSAIIINDNMINKAGSDIAIKNFTFLCHKSKIKTSIKALKFIWRSKK